MKPIFYIIAIVMLSSLVMAKQAIIPPLVIQNYYTTGNVTYGNITYGNTTGGNVSWSDLVANFVNRSIWTTIDNYPAACPAGEYVSGIGDALTCAVPAGGSGTKWIAGSGLYNDSTTIFFNDTLLNNTILRLNNLVASNTSLFSGLTSVNSTMIASNNSINSSLGNLWTNFANYLTTSIWGTNNDSIWTALLNSSSKWIVGTGLYNDTTTIYYNDTRLNTTIQSLLDINDTKLNWTDQRYNDTTTIQNVNLSIPSLTNYTRWQNVTDNFLNITAPATLTYNITFTGNTTFNGNISMNRQYTNYGPYNNASIFWNSSGDGKLVIRVN